MYVLCCAFQVRKLIKEKKDDPGVSEYLDMEKELQEVSRVAGSILCYKPVR
jgi:survival of motor neuron-related-splicing factor 30